MDDKTSLSSNTRNERGQPYAKYILLCSVVVLFTVLAEMNTEH